jgi:hypothetical protein
MSDTPGQKVTRHISGAQNSSEQGMGKRAVAPQATVVFYNEIRLVQAAKGAPVGTIQIPTHRL